MVTKYIDQSWIKLILCPTVLLKYEKTSKAERNMNAIATLSRTIFITDYYHWENWVEDKDRAK